jgi:ubiquinone/menaquinone biosynthesis C-methylase UbiE
MNTSKWPKVLPPLTKEQQQISDDFMKHWLSVLPQRFSMIERYNQGYPVKASPKNFRTTLEIGAGSGEHLLYETLGPEQLKGYYALDFRDNMCRQIRERFHDVHVVAADCQHQLPFRDNFFDRVLAIHVLEHLPDLPSAIREAHRVCKKDGTLIVVIPCEGGLLYGLARRISAQRIFEKRYKQSYRWFIEHEHINRPEEIIEELSAYFTIQHRSSFPFPVPFAWCNLCLGMKLTPKAG